MPDDTKLGNFRGIPVTPGGVADAVETILSATRSPEPAQFRFVNSYTMALADRDASYERLLKRSGTNFVDGRPLHWVLRTKGNWSPGHARGPAVFEEVLRAGLEVGVAHFFYGTNSQTLDFLVEQARQRFPGISVAGVYAPGYGPIEDEELSKIVFEVERTKPDIVWVALGTPKQDFVAADLVARTGVVAAAVGAAFDFTAGTKSRAPNWMQRAGLEWLFRLLSEPRRLWRRYLWGNTHFARLALRELRARKPTRE